MSKLIYSLIAAALLLGTVGLQAQETVTSKYKVSFYGQVKTDVIYDAHGVTGDDYNQYVLTDLASERDFRVSARGTRLGFDITDGENVSGKIETDFLGVTDSASATDLRLRHAFMTLKAGKFEVLAGQTWHLLPLEFSGTNNEFALGYSGVLWMRAPQLRVTYKPTDKLSFAAALVRPTRKLVDSEGTASGMPQGQLQAQLKAGKAKFTLMGAMGQWRNTAWQKGDVILADFGWNIPLTSMFTLNGQAWTGKNLYDFLGGLGNMGYGSNGIRASGGFANLLIKPAGKFSFNAAYGMDNPVNTKIARSATSKTKNTTMLANVNYLVYEKVTVTMEAARQVTEYKLTSGCVDKENLHYQFSMKFPF